MQHHALLLGVFGVCLGNPVSEPSADMFSLFSQNISKSGCKGPLVSSVLNSTEFREECEGLLTPELVTVSEANIQNVSELIRLNPFKLLCYGVMDSLESACTINQGEPKPPTQINQDEFCSQPRQFKIPSECNIGHCELMRLMSEMVLKNSSVCNDICLNQGKPVPACLYFDMMLNVLFTEKKSPEQPATTNDKTVDNSKTESKAATEVVSSNDETDQNVHKDVDKTVVTEAAVDEQDKAGKIDDKPASESKNGEASDTKETVEPIKGDSESKQEKINEENPSGEAIEKKEDDSDDTRELNNPDVSTVQEAKELSSSTAAAEEKIDTKTEPAEEEALPAKDSSEDTENTQTYYKGSQGEDTMNTGVFSEDQSNFFAYFLLLSIVCIIAYLVFHNKQKILALILEGRRSQGSRRRSGGREYRKLGNLEDSMDINRESSLQQVIY